MNIIEKIYAAVPAVPWDKLELKGSAGATPADEPFNWQSLLDGITDKVFILAGIVAFLFILYSGFIYITAGGNPDATKKGQQGLMNAVLGLVIVFLSYGIVRFVVSFLNTA